MRWIVGGGGSSGLFKEGGGRKHDRKILDRDSGLWI